MAERADAEFDLLLQEHKEIQDVYEKLRAADGKLVGSDGKTEALPNNPYSFLLRLLANLKAGQPTTILQSRHELTTVEAGKILGVSRQYLIQLLEKGEIPFHKTGTHHRLYALDVLAYKVRRDASRRKTLDQLARREFDAGAYEAVPDDFHSGK